MLTIEYKSSKSIPSCNPSKHEIEVGDKVVLELKAKNPLWPEYVVAVVSAPLEKNECGRTYLFTFDESQLNGGPVPDGCDFLEPRCYGCCDEIRAQLPNQFKTFITADTYSDLTQVDYVPSDYTGDVGGDGQKLLVQFSQGHVAVYEWQSGSLQILILINTPNTTISAAPEGGQFRFTANYWSSGTTQESVEWLANA